MRRRAIWPCPPAMATCMCVPPLSCRGLPSLTRLKRRHAGPGRHIATGLAWLAGRIARGGLSVSRSVRPSTLLVATGGRRVLSTSKPAEAYANGQRYLSKKGPERERFSDPDASWRHRSAVSTRKGGCFYGFKVHAVVCARTDLPVAWQVETAASHESNYADSLLGTAKGRGFSPETATLDLGYDTEAIHAACEDRDCRPIIPLKQTPAVKAGKAGPPTCEHGEWRFAGAYTGRARTKWRCPTGDCSPFSQSVKADRLHPLVPRESKPWKSLYRGRAAVEREFGRSRMSGRYCPSACEGSSGCGSMPT